MQRSLRRAGVLKDNREYSATFTVLITCLSHCLQPVGERRIVSLQDLSIDIIANDLQDYDDGRRIHPYVLDAQQVQLELAFREVVAAEILHGFSHAYTAVDLLREALSIYGQKLSKVISTDIKQQFLQTQHWGGLGSISLTIQ